MFSPTPAKVMVFALVLTSLLSVYLSYDSPMTSTEASQEKIKKLTSSSEQTKGLDFPTTESSSSSDMAVAPDRPQNGANDLNTKVIEEKESWTYTYTYSAIGVSVLTGLCFIGLLCYITIWPQLRAGIPIPIKTVR